MLYLCFAYWCFCTKAWYRSSIRRGTCECLRWYSVEDKSVELFRKKRIKFNSLQWLIHKCFQREKLGIQVPTEALGEVPRVLGAGDLGQIFIRSFSLSAAQHEEYLQARVIPAANIQDCWEGADCILLNGYYSGWPWVSLPKIICKKKQENIHRKKNHQTCGGSELNPIR